MQERLNAGELDSHLAAAEGSGGVFPACRIRPPAVADGASVWELVRKIGVLDLNSAYFYVMMGGYFAATSLVAEHAGRILGFVWGFRPPERPETLFVWQIGVAPEATGRGIAGRLLRALLDRPACRAVRCIEATVAPTNLASAALFRALARDLGTPCVVSTGFPATLFPEANHEPERLFRIGPFGPQID